MNSLRVAIVQHRPVAFDLKGSTQKVITLLNEAADQQAGLVVFGESWLSGYPAWIDHCPGASLWNNEAVKEVYARMHQNSPSVDGAEIRSICDAAKKRAVMIVLGFNEKIVQGPGNGTLYNAFIIIDSEGTIVNHHRKLVPTFNEKLLYGQGDAAGLKTVTSSLGNIGALICWEHWMPLSRQVLHNENELVHCALWPSVHEMHQVASRHYAFEGRCFVIAAGQVMQVKDIPDILQIPEHLSKYPEKYILNGGSCVIDPKGNFLLQPQFDKESIYYCNIEDTGAALKEKITLDTSGHYNRWDLFDFTVDKKRKT